jgi:hypothetical protein
MPLMNQPSIVLCTAVFALCTSLGTSRAEEKFDCSAKENVEVAETLRPLIEEAKLCKGLKQKVDAGLFKVKLKIDRTKSVKVERINYCTSEASRKIEANVSVECETDEDEEVQIELAESFDVAVVVSNKTCAVTDFRIEPEGDIGKLIAKNIDFAGKVRKAVEREIAKVCDSAS